ncbi:cytochrome c3 family protein [Thermosulfuriphilus sp.]
MPATRQKTKPLRWGVFLLAGVAIFGLVALAFAGDYLNSAHGNASSGVKRTQRTDTYTQGNCGHCHEQHGVINGSSNSGPFPFDLFKNFFNTSATTGPYTQNDNFCFSCHGSPSLQANGIINNDYAQTFGGYTTQGPATILEAFNQTSYHNLYDIWNFARTNFSSFFKDQSNPCVACHNPHLAKRIKANPTNPAAATAVSRPTDHGTLWGDGTGEKMSDFSSGKYQAPLHYSSGYEPGGSSTYNGSNLPDYTTFCTDCHNSSNTIYSTTLGRNLRPIDWISQGGESGPGDKHGLNAATDAISMNSPFASAPIGISIGFVLSCLDCHEPHGSANPFLIRREVNGVVVTINDPYSKDMGNLCRACHMDDKAAGYSSTANRWEYIHHKASDRPYAQFQCIWCHSSGGVSNCLNCHMHGKDDSWAGSRATGRICF